MNDYSENDLLNRHVEEISYLKSELKTALGLIGKLSSGARLTYHAADEYKRVIGELLVIIQWYGLSNIADDDADARTTLAAARSIVYGGE